MLKILLRCLLLSIVFLSSQVWAQVEHRLIRRVVVFPILAPESPEGAEEAWWKVREELTKGQRFLVASRNFLLQKDVFQARSALDAADAIVLGKLLDAHALMTFSLEGRKFSLRVYEGEYGRSLWFRTLELSLSLPLKEQLANAAVRLVNDFIAAIPYQGFVVRDELRGRILYTEKSQTRFLVRVPEGTVLEPGDKAQIIRLVSDSLKPLFSVETPIEVVGEGEVISFQNGVVAVKLLRIVQGLNLKEGALIRLPRERERLQEAFQIANRIRLDTTFVSPEMTVQSEEVAERRPLITSLVFFLNLAVFLLLAF